MTKRRIPFGLEGARLGPHDAGLGSIRPDQTVGLGPHDAGTRADGRPRSSRCRARQHPTRADGRPRSETTRFPVVVEPTLVRSQPPVIRCEEVS